MALVAGGGSGFVWTPDTSSNVPDGYSVGSKHYLSDAVTIAGNELFTDPDGTEVTGHEGNGYARITPLSLDLVGKTTYRWINIEDLIAKDKLRGTFNYNGNTITETDSRNNIILHKEEVET